MANLTHTQSMTGFGSGEITIAHIGSVGIELRSTNHKALEIIVHLPEGFLWLEDKIKKTIEKKVSRGRIICSMSIIGGASKHVFINKELLKEYLAASKSIEKDFHVNNGIGLDTLIQLPGVVSLVDNNAYIKKVWPKLNSVVNQATDSLLAMRKKEGNALNAHLSRRTSHIKKELEYIRVRFKQAVNSKLARITLDDERVSFLKNSDITEEIERLAFHVKNFKDKLSLAGPVGKEMDFIAQEMQREANTMAAKSFDLLISARVIQVKSEVEKIREQLQNVE